MNKQEYMYNLFEALTPFGDEVRQEIVDDYEEHFSMGLSEGKTEEQIVEELGSIDDLVNELKDLSSNEKKAKTGNSFEFDVDKFTEKVNDLSKSFASAFGTLAASFSNGAEKVVNKTSELAKDFKTSYDQNRSEAQNATPDEKTGDGDVRNLVAEIDNGEVITDLSSDGAFHVYYKNFGSQAQQLAYKFDYTSSGDTAYVTVKRQPGSTSFFARLSCPKVEVKLEIPENFGKVTIKSGAGNVTVNDVISERFDVKLGAGNVTENNCIIVENTLKLGAGNATINNIKCDTVAVNNHAGNVTVSGLAREVGANSNAGNVTVDAEVKESVTLGSNAGNVTARLKNCDGYSASLRCSLGNTRLVFRDSVTSSKGSGNGKFMMGDGSVIVDCSSSVGNVTIEA